MSRNALEYYSGLAERFGSRYPIPEVLSGRACILSEPDQQIFIRQPNLLSIPDKYRGILSQVGEFAIHNSAPVDPKMGKLYPGPRAIADKLAADHSYAMKVFGLGGQGLIPLTKPKSSIRVSTGFVRNVQVEAFAPDELPAGPLTRVVKRVSTNEAEGNAYLVTSAELVMGRSVDTIAHLAMVNPDEDAKGGYKVFGTPVGVSELPQMTDLQASRKNAAYLGAWALMSPIEQLADPQ